MIVAVLDACVLVPSVLADTLLRCAEQDLYRPLWTRAILDEVRRNLPPSVLGVKAERRIEVMREHFPEAMVSGHEHLIAEMTNDPKDRHVLAAADAEMIVTANLLTSPTVRSRRTPSRHCIRMIFSACCWTMPRNESQTSSLSRRRPPEGADGRGSVWTTS
ncbi:PIN domain-containing protein [Micromonospora sp. AB353]|uniref:PIN domain-containing protein n=1 Tax=Micromonospora sp. AB353 TaxID=3413282 RepID=UPI003C26749B